MSEDSTCSPAPLAAAGQLTRFSKQVKKTWPPRAHGLPFWRVSARSTQPGTPLAAVFERIGNCLKKYEKSSDMFIIAPDN